MKVMPRRRITPNYIAAHIRRVLKDGGSAPHSEGMQRFFKEEVKARGWHTDELRKVSVRFRRTIHNEIGLDFLVQVADRLFRGRVLEEKVFAVLLLEKVVGELGNGEFRLFESWLSRVSSWADHDALVHYLIAPMIAAEPGRRARVFVWAKSRDRWHRRAACVGLIQGTRRKMFFPEITRLSNQLLADEDDMVQKGLGWLLRETAKADAKRTLPYLMKIRSRAPRLVLRTACETLPKSVRARVLNHAR
jgi:3-methyladenine DNA glycosylase AlkD